LSAGKDDFYLTRFAIMARLQSGRWYIKRTNKEKDTKATFAARVYHLGGKISILKNPMIWEVKYNF